MQLGGVQPRRQMPAARGKKAMDLDPPNARPSNEALTAARRTEQVWWEQICAWESLEYGVAFTCARYPTLAKAQQLRDVWLADVDGPDAFERAEAWFAERGLTCGLWSPASGQPVEPVAEIMGARGWRAESLVVLRYAANDTPAPPEPGTERILPARAMRRAYRTFLESLHAGDSAACDAAFDRLDDASYEVLLAVQDGEAVARIGYHEVGEFARLRDFSFISGKESDAARGALMAHFLLRARRMIVACAPVDAADEIAYLQNCGFTEAGRLPQFTRPA